VEAMKNMSGCAPLQMYVLVLVLLHVAGTGIVRLE
jgi:hypothetical protein